MDGGLDGQKSLIQTLTVVSDWLRDISYPMLLENTTTAPQVTVIGSGNKLNHLRS